MLQTQFRPALLHNERRGMVEGVIFSFRQFSVTQQLKDDSPSQPSGPSTSSATTPSRPGPRRRPNIPPTNPNAQDANASRFRASRAVDARFLAASQGNQANIIRGPRLQFPRGGIQNRRPRKPTGPAKKSREPRFPRISRRQPGSDEGDNVREAEIDSVYNDLAEKARPVPSRYTPQAHDFSTLRETWPSLPTGATAQSTGVLGKLSLMSGRYPNGYIPPHELGKRLYRGESVHFFSEEEKTQAIEEAKNLAQRHADKLSQKKGDLVDPEEVHFNPINAEDQKTLVKTLVQGIYPKLGPQQTDNPAVLGNIKTNLRNNQTYRNPGKDFQFLAKFESLLASSRPVKRT